ncbi:serine/threonine-protein kinase [Catenuloplanes japonicus]|uniref:serine/threonine-protein kinase n=1 Tax=Catenuloplanes japonicus TaxID=33876 RepID=UPI000690C177|nr:serine/threonine-protein kinase [Catenuloplanes japonicus]
MSASCLRPGCPGHYLPDGYCDECGRKAPAGAVPEPATGAQPSHTAAGGTRGSARTGSGRTRGSRSGRSGTGRGRLGAGLVEIPRVPLRDPATAVMTDPVVSEPKRYCTSCDKPVGRGRDGRPGRTEGFCPHCGTAFSFLPRLAAGDVVHDRYEVLGALAYGGLGWIYLARDRNVSDSVSDRWVVLKGLINTADPDAAAAAVTERRYLVEIDHPNIVKIHDFVQHPDAKTGEQVGYIVMEYVGGRSLRDLLVDRRERTGEAGMPLAEVIAYGVEILPALDYLHGRDLLFCDFKPDNVIQAEEQLKLIDLGAVRHLSDEESAIYGTPGYQAPEIADEGPSVASDLYTVGRTLAVMALGSKGFTSTYADRLPTPDEAPLLALHDSFLRVLQRATHREADRRFASAGEFSEQLLGVLREVLSAADGTPRPSTSLRFTPERRTFGTAAGEVVAGEGGVDPREVAAALPTPLVDVLDPGAGFLASLGSGSPAEVVRALTAAPVTSPEVAFRLVRAHIDAGDLDTAAADLDVLAEEDPLDWRVDWHRGLAALAGGDTDAARTSFESVYRELPGERAARLALAAACECAGDTEAAAAHYARVWAVDRGFLSAAFGLARLRLAGGDRAGALTVLDQVPESSAQYLTAQVAATRAGIAGTAAGGGPVDDLIGAARRLERLTLDTERQSRLAAELLETALAWLGSGTPPARGTDQILGNDLTERGVRFGLERTYRMLAQHAHTREERWALVDRANAVRPRTLV